MVDDGRVRRGRPAARMVFGNGIVVLVGDFCLARALETVAATGSLPLVQSLAATVTEMAEGEVAQLERAGNPDATTAALLRRHRPQDRLADRLVRPGGRGRGPAALRRPPWAATGGRWAGPSRSPTTSSTAPAAESVAGKSVGHDLQEGKLTLPVLLACDADPSVRDRIRAGAGRDAACPPRPPASCWSWCARPAGWSRPAPGRWRLVDEALAELAALPPSPYRDALRELAVLSVERVS